MATARARRPVLLFGCLGSRLVCFLFVAVFCFLLFQSAPKNVLKFASIMRSLLKMLTPCRPMVFAQAGAAMAYAANSITFSSLILSLSTYWVLYLASADYALWPAGGELSRVVPFAGASRVVLNASEESQHEGNYATLVGPWLVLTLSSLEGLSA